MIIIQGIEFYAVKELSKILGLSEQGVRIYLKKGRLKGVKIGRHWWVSEKNINKFLKGE